MNEPVEAELKLRAPDDATLDLLATLPALGSHALGPATIVRETDVYLDTSDGRLAAARWALRLRTRDGRTLASLKGPAEHHPGEALHRRPEVEGPVDRPSLPSTWPGSAARSLVLELAGEAELVERLTLLQERTERAVDGAGRRIGTLSLDRVQVLVHGRSRGRLRVVELELDPTLGYPRQAALAPELLERLVELGLRPDPASKLELALGFVG